jgi:hypothetical protein
MKASEIKSGIKENVPNPVRRCKKMASTTVRPYAPNAIAAAAPKTINSKGHDVKKIEKAPNLMTGHTKSSKLTELKKKAKKLGITQINKYDEKQLLELIAKAECTPQATKDGMTVDEMRAAIKEKGGNLPRGMKSRDPEALKAVLDDINDKD